MLSEERIMEIAECCPVWYAIPQGREKALLIKFARAIEREVAKGCPRCAELSESLNNRAREQAQKTVNNEVYLDKLATLEAEKEEIKQAIRWAPSSAHWSNVLIKLCGEDSRDGINALEKQLREAQATIAQQAEQLAAAQKVIDAAGNLIAQEGRHNTEIAYKRLAKAIAEQKEGK